MSVLIDTNIIARLVQDTSPHHQAARLAVESLKSRAEVLCITPQAIYEFWVVCTRPIGAPHNGLGLTVEQTNLEIVRAKSLFSFLPDTPAVYNE